MSSHRIVVVTPDVLGEKMAGPAIRAWKIAEALSAEHEVVLLSTVACSRSSDRFSASFADKKAFVRAVDWAEIVIHQGEIMATQPSLSKSSAIKVADLYDPIHLEVIEQSRALDPDQQLLLWGATLQSVIIQIIRCDFFLCASPKQRDFYLGHLAARGRLNPATLGPDLSVDSLLAIVPFGIEENSPKKKRSVMRGVVPGITDDDYLLLWGGGIYNWFDPLTLLRAVARVVKEIPTTKLVFMGATHPNPNVPAMQMAQAARDLSLELGLTDKNVFFLEDWVPYEDRADYLLEADVAVSTHFAHTETEFSFRTRLLDCFWASLPVVASSGDSLSAAITEKGAGRIVAPEDERALAEALLELGRDREERGRCAARSGELAADYRWSIALAPLVEFCRNPHRAHDLSDKKVRNMVIATNGLKIRAGNGIFPLHTRVTNFFHLARRREFKTIKQRFAIHFSPYNSRESRRRRKADKVNRGL